MCIFSKKCPTNDVDLTQPRFDETTFAGRAKEYFLLNNPLFAFASNGILECAKDLLDQFKYKTLEPPCPTDEELWEAKFLVDSAYHPDTDERVAYPARRATRIFMDSLVVGGMLAYYRNMIAVGAWQTINQGFNAFVTNANRTDKQNISDDAINKACGAATLVAVSTAIGLGCLCKKMYDKLYWRMVPFLSVALADCVRVPLLRGCDLENGVAINEIGGKPLGYSTNAANKAVGDDIICRMMMAAPALLLPTFLGNYLEKRGTLCRYPWINYPTHVFMVALYLTFLTPLLRGLFEDKGVMWIADVEDDIYCNLRRFPNRIEYDRGLPWDLQ